ncbi:MAG: TlpA disulfide reductase family protein [Bryobacteraceae bacterium]
MLLRTLVFLLPLCLQAADLVPQVRALIAQGNIKGGQNLIEQVREKTGDTPEVAEAISWLGRGSLAANDHDLAELYAQEVFKVTAKALKTRKLDDEPRLPIALGAAIEVNGQVLARRGERAEAVAFLRTQLTAYAATSIVTRIQKNINLLTLEGKPAPLLRVARFVGPKPPQPLAALRGKPVLLFFWAHWCPDCKQQAAILTKLKETYKDLVILGPTKHYGYVAAGEEASPEAETKYIEQIRHEYYAEVPMTIPLSEANFKAYGASTTPTLVLMDRRGIIRLYHPGRMTYDELAPKIAEAVAQKAPAVPSTH